MLSASLNKIFPCFLCRLPQSKFLKTFFFFLFFFFGGGWGGRRAEGARSFPECHQLDKILFSVLSDIANNVSTRHRIIIQLLGGGGISGLVELLTGKHDVVLCLHNEALQLGIFRCQPRDTKGGF